MGSGKAAARGRCGERGAKKIRRRETAEKRPAAGRGQSREPRGRTALRKKVPYFSTPVNEFIFNIYNRLASCTFDYIKGTILFIKIVFFDSLV